ncbi:MAG: hypothetical protein ABIG39_04680 [Candidatus Micrarchaeota archaeon]
MRLYRHHNDSSGNNRKRDRSFPEKHQGSSSDAKIVALREAVKTCTIYDRDLPEAKAARRTILEKAKGIGNQPKEVQEEIIRSLKKVALLARNPINELLEMGKQIPQSYITAAPTEGSISKMFSDGILEINEFMAKRADISFLEQRIRGKTDFEVAAVMYLSGMDTAKNLKQILLERRDMDKEMLYMVVCALVFRSDFNIMIQAVQEAESSGHPQLRDIVDIFSMDIKRMKELELRSLREIIEGRGVQVTTKTLIAEMENFMHAIIRRNAPWN